MDNVQNCDSYNNSICLILYNVELRVKIEKKVWRAMALICSKGGKAQNLALNVIGFIKLLLRVSSVR
jgi:hypothetical protein